MRFSAHPFAVLLSLSCVTFCLGQESATVTPAKPDSAVVVDGIRELKDIAYVSDGHPRQRLDLFLPEKVNGPLPLVVWVHGGGWEGGTKNNCPAKPLVAKGYAVASIGYRLSQHAIFPAQIQDCKAAVRWLRAHGSEYDIDPERFGAWGASAGGHLVALLGTTGQRRDYDVGENLDQPSSVQCVIDWFGPTDFLHYGNPPKDGLDTPGSAVVKLLGGLVRENRDKAKLASPIYYIERTAPPFLIMQGDQDNLVPLQQSEIFAAALKEAGVSCELCVLPGAGHGGPSFSSAEKRKLMTDFLGQHLLKPTVAAD